MTGTLLTDFYFHFTNASVISASLLFGHLQLFMGSRSRKHRQMDTIGCSLTNSFILESKQIIRHHSGYATPWTLTMMLPVSPCLLTAGSLLMKPQTTEAVPVQSGLSLVQNNIQWGGETADNKFKGSMCANDPMKHPNYSFACTLLCVCMREGRYHTV